MDSSSPLVTGKERKLVSNPSEVEEEAINTLQKMMDNSTLDDVNCFAVDIGSIMDVKRVKNDDYKHWVKVSKFIGSSRRILNMRSKYCQKQIEDKVVNIRELEQGETEGEETDEMQESSGGSQSENEEEIEEEEQMILQKVQNNPLEDSAEKGKTHTSVPRFDQHLDISLKGANPFFPYSFIVDYLSPLHSRSVDKKKTKFSTILDLKQDLSYDAVGLEIQDFCCLIEGLKESSEQNMTSYLRLNLLVDLFEQLEELADKCENFKDKCSAFIQEDGEEKVTDVANDHEDIQTPQHIADIDMGITFIDNVDRRKLNQDIIGYLPDPCSTTPEKNKTPAFGSRMLNNFCFDDEYHQQPKKQDPKDSSQSLSHPKSLTGDRTPVNTKTRKKKKNTQSQDKPSRRTYSLTKKPASSSNKTPITSPTISRKQSKISDIQQTRSEEFSSSSQNQDPMNIEDIIPQQPFTTEVLNEISDKCAFLNTDIIEKLHTIVRPDLTASAVEAIEIDFGEEEGFAQKRIVQLAHFCQQAKVKMVKEEIQGEVIEEEQQAGGQEESDESVVISELQPTSSDQDAKSRKDEQEEIQLVKNKVISGKKQ